MAVTVLEVQGLTKRFGGVCAVDHVDFSLSSGEIHAVIGPNGAGKSTFVGLIAGRMRPDAGQVLFEGKDITRAPAHRRVRMGMGYTFQITTVFAQMTVLENVLVAVMGASGIKSGQADAAARAALQLVGLGARADDLAAALSYGHQRLLELAMGLALKPRLLILDEPTQGLSDAEVEGFVALMGRICQAGPALLMIEHNMAVVMALAQRITVLDQGRILAQGTPGEIRASRAVQEAYLGAPADLAPERLS